MAAVVMKPAIRLAAFLLAPGGARGRLVILIYHRVLAHADPLMPDGLDAETFARQMATVAAHFNVLPLAEAVERLKRNSLPARAACITFDDGYADNHDVALPILRRAGLHATFFIATGYLDGGRMWNDTVIETVRRAPGPALDLASLRLGDYDLGSPDARRKAAESIVAAFKHLPYDERARRVARLTEVVPVPLPRDMMMRTEQVRALHAAGMGIGAHTVTHPILTRVDLASARTEIADGRERLEALIGERVRLFAYPNGRPRRDYAAEHVRLVRDLGFAAAVSTAWGICRPESDLFQLPRFTPWDRTPVRFALRLLKNYGRRVELA